MENYYGIVVKHKDNIPKTTTSPILHQEMGFVGIVIDKSTATKALV